MQVKNSAAAQWVEEMACLTAPDQVVWLEGSDREYVQLCAEAVRSNQLIPLNPQKHPGSFLHRSHPQDVARTEQCTYLCAPTREEAGPNNNWMPPEDAYAKLRALFSGIMRGRTMYVIPYLLGPEGSPFSRVGFELTDSVYVAVNMRIMTRMGTVALEYLGESADFIKGLHSLGSLDPDNRFICHFPQDRTIWSLNTGYGGNALLSKKCAALRIGSWLGNAEGWLAEHMLIMGVQDPEGEITYVAGAFPSACGKTNLAMLQPTGAYGGYRIWCVGDDIAWLRPGADGRLYAINPEAGFFGVAPGTNDKTNPNMMKTISRNTIFTNVGMGPDQTVWWEGLDLPTNPVGFLDWQGRPWNPNSGVKAAQPNSRFTAPIKQCPVYSPEWENPQGVPISAIIFGSRRSKLLPLVAESFGWQHGVYLGATLSSETTAATAGASGVVRTDPMAMLPFCGYNMGDYFAHWLRVGRVLRAPPRIYRVNWFQTDAQGKFLWPGFSENMRVLRWIIARCRGEAGAVETPIGRLPAAGEFDVAGLSLGEERMKQLFHLDRDGWLEAARQQADFFSQFGARLPKELLQEQHTLMDRLKGALLLCAVFLAIVCPAFARDDTMDGPVAQAAQKAIEKENVNSALIWVRPEDEAEVRRLFEQVVSVRKIGQEVRHLADNYFLETVVRLHCQAEGVPYTGLKPAGPDAGPAIPAADMAIEDNFLDPVLKLLTEATEQNVREHFKQVMSKRSFNQEDLTAGRDYVKSYEEFTRLVERIYKSASQPLETHDDE